MATFAITQRVPCTACRGIRSIDGREPCEYCHGEGDVWAPVREPITAHTTRYHDNIQNRDVWVTYDYRVIPITELETKHLKRILDAINMGDSCYRQEHKSDAIAAEYKTRL